VPVVGNVEVAVTVTTMVGVPVKNPVAVTLPVTVLVSVAL
jgi:hypothetical protein